jgi:hypothetical protein
MARDTYRRRALAAKARRDTVYEARAREERRNNKALAKWGTVPQQISRAYWAERAAAETAEAMRRYSADEPPTPPEPPPGPFTKLFKEQTS